MKNMRDKLRHEIEVTSRNSDRSSHPSSVNQPLLPFSSEIANQTQNTVQTRRTSPSNVVRLGNPAIPVKITEYGTCLAKLDHIWRAARMYAKRNNYKLLEMYGVIGVVPFCNDKVGAWFGYLKVPYRPPLEVYQLYDKDLTWIAEWTVG